MIAKRVRIATHALLFLLAVVVFYLGLGLGLSFNPLLGSTHVACRNGTIVDLNLFTIRPVPQVTPKLTRALWSHAQSQPSRKKNEAPPKRVCEKSWTCIRMEV